MSSSFSISYRNEGENQWTWNTQYSEKYLIH